MLAIVYVLRSGEATFITAPYRRRVVWVSLREGRRGVCGCVVCAAGGRGSVRVGRGRAGTCVQAAGGCEHWGMCCPKRLADGMWGGAPVRIACLSPQQLNKFIDCQTSEFNELPESTSIKFSRVLAPKA